MTDENSWHEHRLLVLEEFKHLHAADLIILEKLDDVNKTVVALRVDVSALKVKAGVWGLIGGMIPIMIALAMMLIKAT